MAKKSKRFKKHGGGVFCSQVFVLCDMNNIRLIYTVYTSTYVHL